MTLTLPQLITRFEKQAELQPKNPAVLWGDGSLSYQSLSQLSINMADFLKLRGICQGHGVALSFRDELMTMITALSVLRLGARLIVIPPHTPGDRRRELEAIAKVGATVTDIEGLLPGAISINRASLFSRDDAHEFKNTPGDPGSVYIIAQGSGTTGKPKLLPFTCGYYADYLPCLSSAMATDRDTVFAQTIPCDFVTGLNGFLAAVMGGYTSALALQDPHKLKNQVEALGITHLVATVYHMEAYLGKSDPGQDSSMANLKGLMIGGSTLNPSLIKRLKRHVTNNIYNLYGANEVGICAVADPEIIGRTQGSVGRVLPWISAEVVDRRGHPVPEGEAGLLRFKTHTSIAGYVDDPRETKSRFRNGWFYPGDVGKVTAQGELIHLGRADYMMIYNGVNIYPSDIEIVACSHPEVLDAAVMPFKHPVHQDVPVCAVVLAPYSRVSSEELTDYISSKMRTKAVRYVFVLEKIPRNPQGKLIRRELGQILGEELERSSL